MGYGALSELLVLIHFLFAVFVAVGGLLVSRSRMFAWAHLPALVWGIYLELSGAICPLTPIEIAWRELGRATGYEPGLIEDFILPVLYPEALTRSVQLALGATLVLFNALVYWRSFRLRKRSGTG
jgi:hypothetical protein